MTNIPRRVVIAAFVIMSTATGGCGPKQLKSQPPASDPSKALTGGWFEEGATASGIQFKLGHAGKSPLNVLEVMGCGCAALDLDSDDKPDILLVGQSGAGMPGRCALYRNRGDGKFEDKTLGSGIDGAGLYMGVAVADIDNDGLPDILITGYGVNRLYKNLGHMKFRDITAGSGLEAKGPDSWATSAAFADYDGDGLIDVFIGRYVVFNSSSKQLCDYGNGLKASCGPMFYDPQLGSLHRNLGGGKFEDVTRQTGLTAAKGKCLGAIWCDINGDGRPDLYLANDEMPGDLFFNVGGKTFREDGVATGVALSGSGDLQGGMGVDFADFNRDGLLDLFVTTYQFEPDSLYSASPSGVFQNVSLATGIDQATRPLVGFGTRFADIDNDGWPDIIVANGHIHDNQEQIDRLTRYRQPMQLFMNSNGTKFTDMASQAGPGFTTPGVGRALALTDFDGDGKLDVLMTDIDGPTRLLMNRRKDTGHWLRVKLVGTKSNRMALGSLVTLQSGKEKWIQNCTTSGSYLSANDPVLHFGIGALTKCDKLVVRWPNGKVSEHAVTQIDRQMTITEPLP